MGHEKDTMERLWGELHERLTAFIRKRVPREADADDVVQDVFARMHRGLETLTDKTRAPAWMFRIAANAIADHYRDQSRRAVLTDDLEMEAAGEDPVDSVRDSLGRCLEPFLRRLPDPLREAVQLTDIEGASQVAAAKRLGLSVSGMKSRVQRGRALLRELFTDCCRFEFDRRGQVVDIERRPGTASTCCPADGSCSTARAETMMPGESIP